jgi:HK97 family phage portal protein
MFFSNENNYSIFDNNLQNIYFSDYVNNAIDRRATAISKFKIKSIIESENKIKILNDDITRLFQNAPNEYQTTSDFLKTAEWIRQKQGNCFIYPQFEEIEIKELIYRKYKSFYVLNPSSYQAIYDDDGKLFFEFLFKNGKKYIFPSVDIIHLKNRRGCNSIFGGDDNGNINTKEIKQTINILNDTLSFIPKNLKSSLGISGIFTAETVAEASKLKQSRDNFESHIFTSELGIFATDLAGKYTPIQKNPATLPQETIKFLKSIIYERYGVSDAILQGNYTTDEYSAFHELVVEDFFTEFEQAFSKNLFTQRQVDFGHKIKVYFDKANLMSNTNKIELSNLATNTGLLTLNEIRELHGYPPVEDGDIRLQSLNFINSDLVDEYQKLKVGGDKKNDIIGK